MQGLLGLMITGGSVVFGGFVTMTTGGFVTGLTV